MALIYTAVTGGYDTDSDHCVGVRKVRPRDRFLGNNLNAKIYKVFPFRFFNDDITIWIDGNIDIVDEGFEEYMLSELGGYDMVTLNVEGRSSITDELVEIRKNKRYTRYPLEDQVNTYFRRGLPRSHKLYGNGIMVRSNTEAVKEMMYRWWYEITSWSVRDQLSLPYVVWKTGNTGRVKIVDINDVRGKYVNWRSHKQK